MRWILLAGALAACSGGGATVKSSPAPDGAADVVLVGGTVVTMDPLRPRAEAVALRDGRVEAVGSAAEVRRLVGPSTRVVDLEGHAVTPGLVDAHCHLYGLGIALETISLRGAASADEAARRVADGAAAFAPGEWVT